MDEITLLEKIKTNLELYKIQNKKQCFNLLKWIDRLLRFAMFDHSAPRSYRAYSRGQIVKVDFGFNVGYELGGVHYAVVVSKNDSTKSGTVSVIPLTSFKNKKLNRNELNLGSELYTLVDHKESAVLRDLNISNIYKDKLSEELLAFKNKFENKKVIIDKQLESEFSTIFLILFPGIKAEKIDYQTLKSATIENKKFREKLILQAINLKNEISYMKPGSVAKVEQLQLISKNRIVSPIKSSDALHGIHLGSDNMELINSKIKELFIFDNR